MKRPFRRKWTGADDDQLRRLFDSGMAPRELGETLCRSESSVLNRLQKLGITLGGRGRGSYVRWSEADIDLLTDLHGKGLLFDEIAERLGRGTKAVAAKARAVGLCRNGLFDGDDAPAAAVKRRPGRPVRAFSEIERRRVMQFLARGDTLADIARQMRCEVDDIRAIPGIAPESPRGDCGGAGARRQPTTTETAPRYNFFREEIV